MKKWHLPLIGLALVLSSFVALASIVPAHAATRYCDNNSIIRCGALTGSELQQKYAANATGDLAAIYSHYGISGDMVAGVASAKEGVVTKSGDVIVDGTTVATSAQSVGRKTTTGSSAVQIGGTTVYQRATQNVFIVDQQTAFVFFDANGEFVAAIIHSCGNPVIATAVRKPKPAATCKALEAIRIDKDTYDFEATATTENGATVSSYVFTVAGTSSTQTRSVSSGALSVRLGTFDLTPGTYTATVTVTSSLGSLTSEGCKTTFTVPAPEKVEVCNPATGEIITVDEDQAGNYKPIGDAACQPLEVCELSTKDIITIKPAQFDASKHSKDLSDCEETPVLPSTGPSDFLMGGTGLGALTAAGYYWHASRRKLIDTLLRR